MDKPVKLTGMWSKQSKAGEFMAATTDKSKLMAAINSVPGDKVRLLLFTNRKREGRNDPDWNLNAAEVRERELPAHVTSDEQPGDGPGF